MPKHMKRGPRIYNENYNYQEAFEYFDSVDKSVAVALNTVTDDEAVAVIPGEHKSKEIDDIHDIDMDSTVLAEVEKELQRINHRKVYMSVGS